MAAATVEARASDLAAALAGALAVGVGLAKAGAAAAAEGRTARFVAAVMAVAKVVAGDRGSVAARVEGEGVGADWGKEGAAAVRA